jgi:hypothetical protein
LNADTVRLFSDAALAEISSNLDFRKAGIVTFRDNSADFVRRHTQDRSEPARHLHGVFHNLGLGKDGLYFIACGKNPASAVENHSSLRFLGCAALLLVCADFRVVVAGKILQVKASPHQHQKCRNQKSKKDNNNAGASQLFI